MYLVKNSKSSTIKNVNAGIAGRTKGWGDTNLYNSHLVDRIRHYGFCSAMLSSPSSDDGTLSGEGLSMDQATPDQLHPHRVYLTAFDRGAYSQVAWTPAEVEQIKGNLIRTLKLLALTKGHVVIAASHLLESELAREIIISYPDLISKRIVVPALRDDFSSCKAFLEAKREATSPGEAALYSGEEQNNIAQLVDSTGLVVRWNPEETSSWFKKRLLQDLRNDNSLVRFHLTRNGFVVPEYIYADLEQQTTLSRGMVYRTTQKHSSVTFREIVNGYADFLYYLSGARAVHSEGVLPQENIVDFSFSDLQDDRCPLSEREVFTKLFIDAVKAATSTHFPTDLLDALTVPDILSLHEVAIDETFINKYNEIQLRTKAAMEISDPERLVLLMHELIAFESDLHREFTQAISSELPMRLRQMRVGRFAKFIHALASLIILPYGALVGLKDVIISGLRVLNRDALAADIQHNINERLDALRRRVGEALGGEQPTLLHFVDELKSQYLSHLRDQ